MQEKAGEQGAAYIPMPKGRGFTPHFDKKIPVAKLHESCYTPIEKTLAVQSTGSFSLTK